MGKIEVVSGKTFLITGGASGLGAGFAEAFLKEGAKKIAILDIAEKLGNETADRLNNSYPGKVTFTKCDVSKEDDIKDAFSKVVKEFGKVDVIINNAGIMNDSEECWRTACEVNLQGLVSFTMKGLKHMKEPTNDHKGGTIINISSIAALIKFKYLPIYSGCKSAVLHFSTLLASEDFHETTGVRVLTVCFGSTDTALLQNLEQRSYDKQCGETFAKEVKDHGLDNKYQRPESAIRGMVDMFKHGNPGSVWLVSNNRPAIDITSIINNAYESIGKAIMGLTV